MGWKHASSSKRSLKSQEKHVSLLPSKERVEDNDNVVLVHSHTDCSTYLKKLKFKNIKDNKTYKVLT